jgi:hypothetical protein
MNLNPVKGAQIVLAYMGIGGIYLYEHPFLSKTDKIEGPYPSYRDLKKSQSLKKSELNVEFKFKLQVPEGAVRPMRAEK